MLRAGKRTWVGLLVVALAVYGVDCAGMNTHEQAMQCCKTMQCMSHHHRGDDCCKTMPTRVVIGQPSSLGISLAPVALGMVQAFSESVEVTASTRLIADQSHAPPVLSLPSLSPLRI